MTTHLIEYDDVAYLGYNIGYLEQLPQRIEAFKIKLDLVPASGYGKLKEPVLDQTVTTARQGSALWRTSATQIRSLHQDVRKTLTEVIGFMDSSSMDGRVTQVTRDLQRHAAEFKRQQTECDRIIECAKRVTPRFMDFMNVRTFEYAKRKGLLIKGSGGNGPETLSSALKDERSLVSARSTVEWNHRAFSTAVLSAGNMGAYCARLASLLDATVREVNALKVNQSPRRLKISCQSAASAAREAQRLINYTFDHILRFSF
jgi:hypothetical protein